MAVLQPLEAEVRLSLAPVQKALNNLQAMLKKTQQSVAAIGAPAQQVANSVNNIGRAAKQSQSFVDKLGSALGRIALFSVGAAFVVRGFFEITSAIKNTVAEGIKFNATMEQGRIALAAILANTRNVSDAQGRLLTIAESYPRLLEQARDIQKDILLANIETLGTGQELLEVYQLVLANTGQQSGNLDDVLKASQIILNISRLNNEAGEKAVVNARQAFVLEGMRGNTVLRYLNTNIKVARELSTQGQWLQEIIKRGEIYLLLSGEIGDSWEALTSTVETFFSTITGQAFLDIFEGLKVVIKGMGEELLRIDAAGGLKAALNVSDSDLKKLGQSLAGITVDFVGGIAKATAATIKFGADTRSVFEWFSSSQSAGIIASFVAKVVEGWKIIFDGWRLLWEQIAANASAIADIATGLAKLLVAPFAAAFDAIKQGFSKDIGETFVKAIGKRVAEALNQIGKAGFELEFVPPTLNEITDSLNKAGNAAGDVAGDLNLLPKPLSDIDNAAQAAAKAMDKARQSLIEQTAALLIENEELAKAAAGFITLETALLNAEERQNAVKSGNEAAAKAFREAKEANNEYRESIEEANKVLEDHISHVDDLIKARIQAAEATLNDVETIVKSNQELLDENKILAAAVEGRIALEEVEKALALARIDRTIATEEARLAEQGLSEAEREAIRLKIESLKATRGLTEANQELKDTLDKIAVTISTLPGMIFNSLEKVINALVSGTLKFKNIFKSFATAMVGEFVRGFAEIIKKKIGFEKTFVNNIQGLKGLLTNAVNFATSGFGAALTAKLFGAETEEQIGAGAGAFAGRLAGIILAPILGPLAPIIGGALGGIFGGLIGGLFVNLPTKGTQIRQAVVKWLEDIDVSFADQVKSGNYFFKTTKALADELGIGFLEASKIVLETEAGPEIARQIQALGAFITAEAAKELGKPLEQTATTFGNMLIANLGIEAIPDAMAEIIEKAGITFEAVINSLNKAFEKGRISVEFYNDTIQGAIDLFLTDLPAALDVAAVAMQSFTEDGIFSMEIFEEKLEQAVENFTTIGEAAAQALTQGIEEGLSASEVGDLFEEILKAALREAAIAEFVEKFFEDLFKDIDLTKPFELSSAAMAELRDRVEEGSDALKEFLGALGLLPEVTRDWLGEIKEVIAASEKLSSVYKDILLNNEEFLDEWATGLQTVEESLDSIEQTLQGLAGPIASTIIDAMLAGVTVSEAQFVALIQGQVARAVLQGMIEGMIRSFIIEPILELIFAPIKEQVIAGLEDGLPFGVALSLALGAGADAIAQIPTMIAEGIDIVWDFINSPEGQALFDFAENIPDFTVPDVPIDEPVEELVITVEDLADAVDAFVASVEGSEDPFQQLIDDYKELLELFEEFEAQDVPETIVPPDVLLVQESLDLLAATMENLLFDLVDMQDEIESLTGIDIDPIISDIETLLEELAAGEIPSLESLQTLAEDLEALVIAAQLSGVDVNTIDTMKAALDALEDVIAGFPVLEEDLILLADTLGLTEDELELLLEAHDAFVEGLSNEIDAINTTTSIFDDLTETLDEVRDAQEGIRQAFDEGLITLEEFTLLIKELAQATLVELVSELRALTEEIIDMAEEIQDTIESIQEFIDAGEDLSDLESDLADLTDEYEQALKDLRKEMLGVILSGESMGQMFEDINESFENQAQAIGDALIEDLTDPINNFLKSIEAGGSTVSGFNSDFTAMMSDFDDAIAAGDFEAVGDAVNDMVELAEQVHNLIEAFDDLVDSIDDSIQDLIEGGMTLEERANAIGSRIAEGFATIGSLPFEDQLEKAAEIQADLIEQFNVLEELERSRLADAIAVQEAIKESRQEEIQSTIDSLDERIRAHEDAQREIEQVEEEISRIQIDIRKRDLQAALDVIDERIRLQEQANTDLLSAQEKAAEDLLNLQEQTNEELIRMAEDFRSAAESIREAIDDILLSDVSPLTPVQRLQEAQRQFQNVVAAARGGDVGAARELGGVAQQLLAEASSFFASSAPFQAIFGETIKTLDELGIQFDQRALLSEQEIVERAVNDVEEAILLTGQESVEELREARRTIEQELSGLDDTLENQLAEAQDRLAELNGTLENNVDELIVTRDALVQELEDLDEAFNRDVEELTKAFDVLISGHRKDTVDQLLALKGIAETSRDSLQDIETDVVAELTDIADNVIPTAVNDIVGTFLPPVDALVFNTGDLGPIVEAINKPLWVDLMITVLNNIASKVGAAAVSIPPPPFHGGGGGFVPPVGGPRVLTWPGFGSSPPSPSLLSQFDFVQFTLPGGGFSNLVKAQRGGIFTRPTMGLLGEAGPEAVIPLRRSESVFDIDYDRLGAVVAEALSGSKNGPSQNNINIEVKTEDGETIVRRTIRTMSDESRTGKILIDGRAISRRGRFKRA